MWRRPLSSGCEYPASAPAAPQFRQEGLAAVVHGNCGRQPVNRTAPALQERILALAGPAGKYHDLNVCHLQELLEREAQIVIGRSTLDRRSSRRDCVSQPRLSRSCTTSMGHGTQPKACCCRSTVVPSPGSRRTEPRRT